MSNYNKETISLSYGRWKVGATKINGYFIAKAAKKRLGLGFLPQT